MKRGLLLACLLPAFAFAGNAERGRELALARIDGGCLLCHAIPGAERPAGNIGPSLAGIGSRRDERQLREQIRDASRFNPETVMPPYGRTDGLYSVAPRYRGKPLLSEQQIEDLAAFLATLR
ncbi:MAG TPA: sulfur oxidation c-type cytochrome SoxX [Burkholderiales bacterium]|jgi:sulfur-oxidizing protein SoxX|nr:sulfur oxidation c-type cytochrome SoxX [Burkholderiales bacterium]